MTRTHRRQAAPRLITHRFKLDQILDAYETFGNAAKTKALKVIIEAYARWRRDRRKETASAWGYMLRPVIHRTLGAVASGSASTSQLHGNGSGLADRKSVGSLIREISVIEQ